MAFEDVNKWKLSISNKVVAQVLLCMVGIESPRIVSKSLGGHVYVQTVGDPIEYADLKILSTRQEKAKFDRLEAQGYPIVFVYRETKYTGYFEEPVTWSAVSPGEYYTAQGKILITDTEEFAPPVEPDEPDEPDDPIIPPDPGDDDPPQDNTTAVLGTAVLGTMILGKR